MISIGSLYFALAGRLSFYCMYDICISYAWQIMLYFGFNEWRRSSLSLIATWRIQWIRNEVLCSRGEHFSISEIIIRAGMNVVIISIFDILRINLISSSIMNLCARSIFWEPFPKQMEFIFSQFDYFSMFTGDFRIRSYASSLYCLSWLKTGKYSIGWKWTRSY